MQIAIKAYAKVNLSLEVIGKPVNGFHKVKTVIQAIDLADEVILSHADRLTFHTEPTKWLTDDNLALQAALLIKRQTGCALGANIRLIKHIPEASGLGGGSSDAAAVLVGLNKLLRLGLEAQKLAQVGASLGSDVPFFVYGGTVLAEGRGEIVTPLPSLSTHWVVLMIPPFSNMPSKTKQMYSLLNTDHYSDGSATEEMVRSIGEGRPDIENLFYNVFERVADLAFPGIPSYRRMFMEAGAPWVRLAGSGPAMFTMFSSKQTAVAVYENIVKTVGSVYLIRTLTI